MCFFVSGPTATPSSVISPLVCFVSPAIIFISVVLPLPFGPSSAYVFPFSKVRDKSDTASLF